MVRFCRERGYDRIDEDDYSTLLCSCGHSFRWAWIDHRLGEWLALHDQHAPTSGWEPPSPRPSSHR